jgi:hypothetical protein
MIPKRALVQAGFNPAPGQYERYDGFDDKWKDNDILTAPFRDPVPKKIVPVNLYNPHSEPDNEKKKHPEMCTYDVPREFDLPRFNAEDDFEPRLNITTGGRIMVDSNLDRFGQPIRPTKPICLVPGPGNYDVGMQ